MAIMNFSKNAKIDIMHPVHKLKMKYDDEFITKKNTKKYN